MTPLPAALALAATLMAVAVAAALIRAQRGGAVAGLLASVCGLSALAALGLGAPQSAMGILAFGVAGVGLLAVGAALLIEPRKRPERLRRPNLAPALISAVLFGGLAMVLTAPAPPPPAAARAAAIGFGAFEAVLALALLTVAGFAVFALLGFGERAAPARRPRGRAEAPP